jgi:two-component system, NtrC family, sensor kinase
LRRPAPLKIAAWRPKHRTVDEHTSRILVIDDNPAIHADFIKILAARNAPDLDDLEASLFGEAQVSAATKSYIIDSAHQGQEGLEKVRKAAAAGKPYQMAFVDIRMPPGWDGIETIAHVWREQPELEVVLCSAYSDYSWEDIVARLDVSDRLLILKKPFDNIEVRQLAHALTEKWSLRRKARLVLDDLNHLVEDRTRALMEANDNLKREMEQRAAVEVELRHAQRLEAIGRLAAGVAHEINTPLQYISDNVSFLGGAFTTFIHVIDNPGAPPPDGEDLPYLKEEVPEALAGASEGLDKVTRIVRALREFGYPAQAEKQAADLNRAITSSVIVAHREYGQVAELETELGDIPTVQCHVADLNQVFLNLIVNAGHAIADTGAGKEQPKGKITIRTRRDGEEYVAIEIADTGTGIPHGIRDKVFEPFFTTKGVGRGTGQGLAISRNIVVDRHAGSLSFDSREGTGTTFLIRLPIAG